MKKKLSWQDVLFNTINTSILIVLSILFIYPLLYVLFASLSDPSQLIKHTGLLLKPLGFSLKGYKLVLSNPNIFIGYVNTLIYVICGTFINVIMTSLGAYILTRKSLLIRKPLNLAIVFTMYFSGGLIPLFLVVNGLGMYDSRLAILIPTAISTWNLMVMRTSFAHVPASLEEAAKLDGANDFTILFSIYFPAARASVAVITLFYAVAHWNSWFNAMIFLQDRNKYPLQLFLREILISGNVNDMNPVEITGDYNDALSAMLIKYCTIIISTVPILCIYPFLQKYFAKGVMVGSVKE